MTAGNASRPRPFPFLLALSGLLALFAGMPAQADPGWHGDGRGRGDWHHGWRRGEDGRRWGGPGYAAPGYGYAAPGYAYAPPVVAYAPAPVYAPPPVLYAPPSLNIIVPLHFP